MRLVLLFYSGLLLSSTSFLYSQEQPAREIYQEGPLVNQRVIILDFVNVQNNLDWDYLSHTIASALEVALAQTENFQMMDKEAADSFIQGNNIDPNEVFNNGVASRVGKAIDSDVVVVGEYLFTSSNLRIISKALNPRDQQIYIALTKEGDASDPFQIIDEMVAEMSEKMVNSLPPIPSRTVIKDTRIVKEIEQVEVISPSAADLPISFWHPLRKPWSFIAWGGGICSLGAGLGLFAFSRNLNRQSLDLYNKYASLPNDSSAELFDAYQDDIDEANALYSKAKRVNLGGFVLLGFGITGIAAGFVFWLYKKKSAPKNAITLFKATAYPFLSGENIGITIRF